MRDGTTSTRSTEESTNASRLRRNGQSCVGWPTATMARSPPPPSALPMPCHEWLKSPPKPEELIVQAFAYDDAALAAKCLVPGGLLPDALLPSGRASRNWTYLHAAAAQGASAVLQLLLSPPKRLAIGSFNRDVDRRAGDGRTPLLLAAEHRHGHSKDCAAIALLVRAGAKPDLARKPDGLTAAHLCCAAGCASCLRLLLQRAPQLVDAVSRTTGEQPLHVAARYGSSECVGALCSLGARVDALAPGERHAPTPLHLACAHSSSARTVRLLLERHARVDQRDGAGHTPLHCATAAGSGRVISELLAFGASPACFGVALDSALRAVREAAKKDALLTQRGETHARRAACRFASLLGSLVRGGAAVRNDDLAVLRLGWNESKGRANREAPATCESSSREGGGGGPCRVSTLFALCQHALANSLEAETVLPTLSLSRLLGARRLQSECERLVLQQYVALSELGAFEAVAGSSGCSARSVLRRLLFNVLSRHAALAHARAEAERAGCVAVDEGWKAAAAEAEVELFRQSVDLSSSESSLASSDGEEGIGEEEDG